MLRWSNLKRNLIPSNPRMWRGLSPLTFEYINLNPVFRSVNAEHRVSRVTRHFKSYAAAGQPSAME